ncbi:MAG TPA: hypothetical protein VJZ91_10975 [Blastocatellia bacterium]|nr:hypothetical protein [Blastocatellia bacterium]
MTTFPGSPRIIKGGLVLLDPDTSAVRRVIVLQYNPDTLTRTLQVQGAGAESGDHIEALRLKGPPVETLKLDAEIDATDQLELPTEGQNQVAVDLGIHPQLAVLEMIIYPTSDHLQSTNRLAQLGTIEVAPAQAPLTLFIWSRTRILPVRVTEFSVTEEAFDVALNPIRAKVSIGMRVLSVNDLGFDNKGGNLFMSYLRQKEQLVTRLQSGALGALGLTGAP